MCFSSDKYVGNHFPKHLDSRLYYICSAHQSKLHYSSGHLRSFDPYFYKYGIHRRDCRREFKSLEQLGHMSLLTLRPSSNAAAARPIFAPRSVRMHYPQPTSNLEDMLSDFSLQLSSLQLWFRDNKQRVQMLRCSGALSNLAFRLVRAKGQESSFFYSERYLMPVIVKRCLSVYAWRHHLQAGRYIGENWHWLDDNNDHGDNDDGTTRRSGTWAVF